MTCAYSHDLLVRVLDAEGAGLSCWAAVLRYRVGIATVRAPHFRRRYSANYLDFK